MAKISVIIPVYNTGVYLEECLESLINQTMQDIEIICINDGSTDNSSDILSKYAKKDSRIKVFSQKNSGPSVARNLGIQQAKGDYITFVDSDDWISLEMCEKIYKRAVSTNSDILLFSMYSYANGQLSQDDRINRILNFCTNSTFKIDAIYDCINLLPVQTAAKLYKSSIIKENNINFPENISVGEDICFIYNLLLYSPLLTIMTDPFYYCRKNSNGSLSKSPDAIKYNYKVFCYIKNKCLKSNLKNKKQFLYYFTKRLSKTLLYNWNNCYTQMHKKRDFKYLKGFYLNYKKYAPKHDETCGILKRYIWEYRLLFIRKLFEPIVEFELRNTRFVIYILGKQVVNIPITSFTKMYYSLFYNITLCRLRFASHYRKIRVGFFVTESSKWSGQNLYNLLKTDNHFEPFILLSYFKNPQGTLSPSEYYNDLKKFFEKNNDTICSTFIPEDFTFEALEKYKPDIIFYQQPWQIDDTQRPEKTHKNSLLCYIPYCFYSMSGHLNYLAKFHGIMWKYFVETDMHKKEYEKYFGAKNCFASGSAKFDGYHFIDSKKAEECWKTTDKKRIIYAPHHSFNDGLLEVATFPENGKFILELAKSHPETEWIFRPHPAFADRLIKRSIMTTEEVDEYYKEWEKIGTISAGGNYYEMFSSSDCLITDCISFLSEYAPTCNPVFHLRKKYMKEHFNELVSKIDEGYYQIFSNAELEETFERVIIKGEDFLSGKREENKMILPTKTLASENIYNYIKKELWI